MCFLLVGSAAFAQAPFPGSTPGVDIGTALPASYEASGLAWHPRLQQMFFVDDNGHVALLEASGAVKKVWNVAGDLEAVCVADPNSNFVYLGLENPDSVLEFNFVTGAVTRQFNLTAVMTGPDNEGLEALTFVPDASNPEGGRFHAGHQGNGNVYIFQLPIKTSAVSTAVSFIGSYTPVPGRTDLADLCYNSSNGKIYAVYDTANRITELSSAGAFLREWVLPGDNQEGLAIRGCELTIAQDQATQKLIRYNNFITAGDCAMLSQDVSHISVAAGGTTHFSLRAPSASLAGVVYVLLGSASGSTPGFDIPPAHIPLNADWYLETIVGQYNSSTFVNTVGVFAGDQTAAAQLNVPPVPALLGTQLSHAWIAVNVPANELGPVSNVVTLTLE